MKRLTPKDRRLLKFAADHLFSINSLLIPTSASDLLSIPNDQHFSRMLSLTNDRTFFLTEVGHKHFRRIVDIVHRANYFDGMADYSDISLAWRRIVEGWLSNGLKPESEEEVLQAISDRISQEIDTHTFVVPIFGIELDGVDEIELGAMSILCPSIEMFDSAGVAHNHTNILPLLELHKDLLWLKGTMRGTERVAQKLFSDQASLTTGILAIAAASVHEGGEAAFRIGIIMRPEDANGRSVWFSWDEKHRSVATHYAHIKSQLLPIKQVLESEPELTRILYRALSILQRTDKNELEEAISRAVFWYSDAQRDQTLVMKLIKYWSCVESFFSFENEEITHAVSSGLASTLVFGAFHFAPAAEYSSLKKEISNLYSLRSRAVHRGSHHHTTEHDVAQFSQWVAWMILDMVALVELGYSNLKEVKEQTDRLDDLINKGAESS